MKPLERLAQDETAPPRHDRFRRRRQGGATPHNVRRETRRAAHGSFASAAPARQPIAHRGVPPIAGRRGGLDPYLPRRAPARTAGAAALPKQCACRPRTGRRARAARVAARLCLRARSEFRLSRRPASRRRAARDRARESRWGRPAPSTKARHPAIQGAAAGFLQAPPYMYLYTVSEDLARPVGLRMAKRCSYRSRARGIQTWRHFPDRAARAVRRVPRPGCAPDLHSAPSTRARWHCSSGCACGRRLGMNSTSSSQSLRQAPRSIADILNCGPCAPIRTSS